MTNQHTATTQPLTADQLATVEANLGLINHVITKMMRIQPDEYEDAHQDGVFGLARAAQLFDPARGFQFSTYAVTRIRQTIQRGQQQRAGINYRHAAQQGQLDTYQTPISLDLPTTTDTTLTDHLAATNNTTEDAFPNATSQALTRYLETCCRDDLDKDIVANLVDDLGHTSTSLGARHGHKPSMVHKRRQRIRRLAANALRPQDTP